ncbi:hypothetical protein [Paraburkholderia franconis]|uniref:hypothetical protein n=1 Tax=Paraburkholderia franconis TaxID=2654983 RepID=UPI00187B8161|nr:hypothetical protein [Paraburkholderia franconis]
MKVMRLTARRANAEAASETSRNCDTNARTHHRLEVVQTMVKPVQSVVCHD